MYYPARRVTQQILGLEYENRHSNDPYFNYSYLIHVTRRRKTKLVRLGIAAGESLEENDSEGNTALCVASEIGFDPIVSLLLDNGACVKAANHNGRTALHLAAAGGFKGIVEKLLMKNAFPHAQDNNGLTPLDLALTKKRKKVVKILQEAVSESLYISSISCGMSPARIVSRGTLNTEQIHRKTVCSVKSTPANTSQTKIKMGSFEIGEMARKYPNVEKELRIFLLDDQRVMNRRFYQLQERLIWQSVRKFETIVSDFQLRAAALAAKNYFATLNRMRQVKWGKQSKHDSSHGTLTNKQRVKPIFIFKSKKKAKQDHTLSTTSNNQHSDRLIVSMEDLLKVAREVHYHKNNKKALRENKTALKLMAKQEIPVIQKSIDGNDTTAVHRAAGKKSKKHLVRLLKAGSYVDPRDKSGRTPLHEAAIRGRTQCLRVLLKFGANVYSKDNRYGSSPLHLAALRCKNECVVALVEGGADVLILDARGQTPLHVSALNGHAACIDTLIDRGTPVDYRCKDVTQRTALHLAAMKGNVDCISVLLEKGAAVDSVDRAQRSALHLATRKGQANCVHILLQNGASVNLADQYRDTALHMAAFIGSEECISVLLEHCGDATVNTRAKDKRTALHVAAARGHQGCIRLLLESGAVQSADRFMNTPLHLAAEGNHLEAVRLLVDAGASCSAKNTKRKSPLDVACGDEVRSILSA